MALLYCNFALYFQFHSLNSLPSFPFSFCFGSPGTYGYFLCGPLTPSLTSTNLSFLTSASLNSLGFFPLLTYPFSCLTGSLGSPLSSKPGITCPLPLFLCLACSAFGRFSCTTCSLLSFPLSLLCFPQFSLGELHGVPLRWRLARIITAHVNDTSTAVRMQQYEGNYGGRSGEPDSRSKS
ncbi:hypothetical protein EDD16DRAFT_929255 [Pisolithus croceorrhizus]|nr:hypothetical protein EDD16DRAFT_929255 [Pisolithus croceorrhizus]